MEQSNEQPWHFGPEPVYNIHIDPNQALRGATHAPGHVGEPASEWHEHRKRVLKDWGAKREAEMHRPPLWCMDQLCSGSNFFPPRHLDDDWFSAEELQKIHQLERLLESTGHAAMLARDMMALLIYDVDIRIIADDSGSMRSGMTGESGAWGGRGWTRKRVYRVFGQRAFRPESLAMFEDCPFLPTDSRWSLLKDHLAKWEEVFQILGVRRKVYFLNQFRDPHEGLPSLLARGPGGGTPMGRTFARVLSDYQTCGRPEDRPLLLLALTDGEANDKDDFNSILDEIQDGLHGDVQVCLMGLSLEPEDIAWFEDEECDDTRIRTIEAWEVEQQMILYRKVIQRTTDYSFAMHTYRALVTNFFPADYDYDAPLQTLRHRLYITLHALDRRFTGQRDATYPYPWSLRSPGGQSCGPAICSIPAALIACVSVGPKSCACLACLGLIAFSTSTSAQQRQRGDRTAGCAFEECLSDEDDQLIGAFVQALQRQSLQGREPQYTGSLGLGFGGRQYRRRPYGNSSHLRALQKALGALSPSEVSMRDLQYRNVSYNNKVLQVAANYLRQAAGTMR
mmetsp:Transcript_126856/g.370918  ORF Transcript_126856/g.370918 Transcript_126856/m.370918 type:complete len:565 (-) Transcript_126856:128-1822(-)